jgi:acyl-CoA synthetase (AMP-forming)/AMP-acid ligase II
MRPLDARLAALPPARHRAPPGPGLAQVALATADPDRPLVADGTRALTRGQALDLALRLGGGLAARGLGPGAVVAFQLPNWWEACVIHLAAALFGYRLVPLLTIYRRAELDHILPAAGVEAVFVPHQWRGTDHPSLIAGCAFHPPVVVTVRDETGASGLPFEALLQAEPATPSPAPGTDAKLIIFTSGSTGRPKGVIHSHDAIDALIRTTATFWGIGPDDRLHVPSPVGHVGGMIYTFEFPWITGCTARLDDAWDPDSAVSLITNEGLSFVAGATPFLSGLVGAAARQGATLPSLRRFVCGGAAVPAELVRRGLKQFPNAVVSRAYGLSEVPLVCPGLRDRAAAEAHADTDGEVAVELRLADATGRSLGPGGEGQIMVRAPQMLLGYLDPADEAGAFDAEGWFATGDLGRLDPAGCLTITGRVKDIIIRKGENLSPLEIETALRRHPAVADCAVVGRPDPERGEMAVAFVVPHPGAAFDMAAMRAHLAQLDLARQKWPEALALLPALPLNAVGKVQKPQLRQMAAALPGPGDA